MRSPRGAPMRSYLVAFSIFGLGTVAGCGDETASAQDAGADLSAASNDLSSGAASQKLKRTDLVADEAPDGGATADPNLINPWGIAFNPAGPIWVSDNHTGVATIYSSAGAIVPLVATVPTPAGGTPPSAPTGQVYNGGTGFMGDKFIFSTEDGTISGWASGATATLRADKSAGGTVYKGLTLATKAGVARIYATDFHNGKVDVFSDTYAAVPTTGGFTDQSIPAGFAPFGVQAVGATIYVAYAKQ